MDNFGRAITNLSRESYRTVTVGQWFRALAPGNSDWKTSWNSFTQGNCSHRLQ